ncbi:MAG: N-acetyltransferase [Alphaproteobacteria bacterium]|nr:N-acetyltransferase [Alphaproteobacteria bacterium]
MPKINIRPLLTSDLTAVKDIYNHYIKHTHINFETNPYSDDYMQEWFQQFDHSGRHHAYVAVQGEQILGFALSQKFRPKPAYSTSIEVTFYLTEAAAGKGLGKKLGHHLLNNLKEQDINRAYAAIALPNDASIGLHKSLGFEQAALLSEVGRKFDKFYDVAYLEYKFS